MKRVPIIKPRRARQIVKKFANTRTLVVGDLMLDHYLWGSVSRISPEAPVPVVDFQRESWMPGGAANVARNLSEFGATTGVFGVVGKDPAANQLRRLLKEQGIEHRGLVATSTRQTIRKIRVVADRQQLVRVDRENKEPIDDRTTRRLLNAIDEQLVGVDALAVGDYGKGVITEELLDGLRERCRARGVWLSFDPKPVHRLRLERLSLITPNRKEVFALSGLEDETRSDNPLKDCNLMQAVEILMNSLQPALLLVTLGELGMLLCQRGDKPFHIPTMAQEVFDVSGAGDTVISSFTMAIAAGASPVEAAIISNHAAGIVVGKVGTATVSPKELLASFGA
ncbi:MAG: D-glycero-beta-D-manno-heptose-7-phosphate kinase [Verrucomicrobiales bacterium]|nr:D-glycero-beta-D-manno-heptose-7-phosphate kinase [Verrucomicrobiales bacterium]